MNAKIRVTTLTKELIPVKDRLVEQNLEFTSGPPEPHKGPIRLELTLRDQGDIDSFKTYLDRLLGNLPIPDKKQYKSKTKTFENELPFMSEDPHEELLQEAIKKSKNQVELMVYLREYGFRFIDYQHLEDLIEMHNIPFEFKILKGKKEPLHKKWQFMIRVRKDAKDLKNVKYDFNLIFGIKIVGEHLDKVAVYKEYQWYKNLAIEWPDKHKINFKKPEIMWKFPPYMTHEERRKWRNEYFKINRPVKEGQEAPKPSKFFTRFEPHITFLVAEPKRERK